MSAVVLASQDGQPFAEPAVGGIDRARDFTRVRLAAVLAEVHSEPRPFVNDASTRLLISHAMDNSFPSDHATLAFAVGGVIVWWRRPLGLVALGCASLVGFARVYVGVHWPSDIVAGALCGIAAGWLAATALPFWTEPQRWASRFLPRLLVSPPSRSLRISADVPELD